MGGYSWKCLSNSLECISNSSIDNAGKAANVFIPIIFLLPDFLDGLLLFFESVTLADKKGIFASSIVMFITFCSFMVAILYNQAISLSNVNLLHDVVTILYL